jgi:hypothetical protein
LPRRGKVKTPIRVIRPIEIKDIKFTKSLDSSEVLIVLAWIKDSWKDAKEFREVNPFS